MKVIVCTSINPPTEAIRRFDALRDWTLLVVGDQKTPGDYQLERGVYISAEAQEKYDRRLSDAIGWNCIQRRNFGILFAHDMKADLIALVDDDNIPYAGWGENTMIDRPVEVNYYETDQPAFDPLGATNHSQIWHRGFPLQLLPVRDYSRKSKRAITPDVQADLWNGDPDIDAFCRMEHAPKCAFDAQYLPLASNAPSPFNSQNTFLSARLLPNYFLFPHVGRMDDIWASYYVQALGAKVVYGSASVYQARNIHNLIRDMQAEYAGYENNLELVKSIAVDPESIVNYLPGRSVEAFRLYRKHFN